MSRILLFQLHTRIFQYSARNLNFSCFFFSWVVKDVLNLYFLHVVFSNTQEYPLILAGFNFGILYYRWKLNGTNIDIGMDYRYSAVEGNLLINNPNKTQDSGTYQCVATNPFGRIVSREAKLQFACKYQLHRSLGSCSFLEVWEQCLPFWPVLICSVLCSELFMEQKPPGSRG